MFLPNGMLLLAAPPSGTIPALSTYEIWAYSPRPELLNYLAGGVTTYHITQSKHKPHKQHTLHYPLKKPTQRRVRPIPSGTPNKGIILLGKRFRGRGRHAVYTGYNIVFVLTTHIKLIISAPWASLGCNRETSSGYYLRAHWSSSETKECERIKATRRHDEKQSRTHLVVVLVLLRQRTPQQFWNCDAGKLCRSDVALCYAATLSG